MALDQKQVILKKGIVNYINYNNIHRIVKINHTYHRDMTNLKVLIKKIIYYRLNHAEETNKRISIMHIKC